MQSCSVFFVSSIIHFVCLYPAKKGRRDTVNERVHYHVSDVMRLVGRHVDSSLSVVICRDLCDAMEPQSPLLLSDIFLINRGIHAHLITWRASRGCRAVAELHSDVDTSDNTSRTRDLSSIISCLENGVLFKARVATGPRACVCACVYCYHESTG